MAADKTGKSVLHNICQIVAFSCEIYFMTILFCFEVIFFRFSCWFLTAYDLPNLRKGLQENFQKIRSICIYFLHFFNKQNPFFVPPNI